jgi:hypothetical protein
VRSGSGRPLLVLHGGPAVNDYSDWFAAELAGWDVLRYTQRGVAPSVTEGPFTIEQHVADALAVLFRLKPRRSRTRCARLTIAPGLASSLARGAGLPGRGTSSARTFRHDTQALVYASATRSWARCRSPTLSSTIRRQSSRVDS